MFPAFDHYIVHIIRVVAALLHKTQARLSDYGEIVSDVFGAKQGPINLSAV